jgi:single-strand DNA-binding protein
MDLNVITLVGRAGRDPETTYFESGKVVCKFAIAVNRTKKDEQADWFELEIWGKTAEVAASYVKKGSLVGITGSLSIDQWKDKTSGTPRSKPFVRVDKLDLLGSRKDNENQGGY